jgi:hypothetical protein
MAAVDENAVSRAVRGLPIRRNKAALIVTSLVKAQDVAGMEAFFRAVNVKEPSSLESSERGEALQPRISAPPPLTSHGDQHRSPPVPLDDCGAAAAPFQQARQDPGLAGVLATSDVADGQYGVVSATTWPEPGPRWLPSHGLGHESPDVEGWRPLDATDVGGGCRRLRTATGGDHRCRRPCQGWTGPIMATRHFGTKDAA